MHGLNATAEDLHFLVNKELDQLALGSYEYQLKFTGEVSVSVQCDVSVEHSGNASVFPSNDINQTKNLACLIGQRVSKVQVGKDQLSLFFTNGYKVTLFDSNRNLESFVIWNNGDFIAV